jgi:hypothetical protein
MQRESALVGTGARQRSEIASKDNSYHHEELSQWVKV